MPDQLGFLMRPIGVIHTPFIDKARTPIQPTRSQATGRVEVDLEFAAGLQDLEGALLRSSESRAANQR